MSRQPSISILRSPALALTLGWVVLAACAAPTDTVVAPGADPDAGAAATATDGDYGAGTLVVLNKSAASASLIDLATGEVVATVETGDGPHEVAVSPDGRWALVANYGAGSASTMTLIDVATAAVVRTIDLGEYRRPHGAQFLADGRHAVVTAEANRALLVVDVELGVVVRSVDTDQDVSHMVAVTPDGSRAFVANIGSGSVTAIDLAAGERIANVATGAGAEGIDVSPDGTEVWITNRAADTITVIDTDTLETRATIPSASFPIRAKFTPDGRLVLVSNARSAEVAVFDAAERAEIARIPMVLDLQDTEGRLFGESLAGSSAPVGILVHPDGRHCFVANTNADVVVVIDLERRAVVGGLVAGREPDGMGYSPLAVEAGSR